MAFRTVWPVSHRSDQAAAAFSVTRRSAASGVVREVEPGADLEGSLAEACPFALRGRGSRRLVSTPSRKHKPHAAESGRWRRWVVDPIVAQLRQGTSPSKLAWTISTGITLGLLPFPGVRGWICLGAGIRFRLNQPLLHTFKGLAFPLHLALIIPFIQAGQWMFGKNPVPLTSEGLEQMMAEGTWSFIQEAGVLLLRATVVWLVVAPLILLTLRAAAARLVRLLARRSNTAILARSEASGTAC